MVGAAAWPLFVQAQTAAPVVGFLHPASPELFSHIIDGFRQGLSDTGFVEGRNLIIEYRWARGEYSRLPALAADLVQRQVRVILTGGGEVAASAAKAATSTIPILFNTSSDPFKAGLADNFNRPGGNITGLMTATSVGALLVVGAPFLVGMSQQLVAMSARHAVPAIYNFRENVLVGGLWSYGASLPDNYRRLGVHAGRILMGDPLCNLPVIHPAKFDFAINLKTANVLGLTIPKSLLSSS